MSTVAQPEAPWTRREYGRIVGASFDAGWLTVDFADGTSGRVDAGALARARGKRPAWERVTFTPHEIVVPTEADDDVIPWDVIRVLTDRAFDDYLSARFAEQAARIGTRLRQLRVEQRLSERELAERVGILPERLVRIEAGEDGISLPTLERLVTAMGQDMRVFVLDESG